jgi:hypothetical protein
MSKVAFQSFFFVFCLFGFCSGQIQGLSKAEKQTQGLRAKKCNARGNGETAREVAEQKNARRPSKQTKNARRLSKNGKVAEQKIVRWPSKKTHGGRGKKKVAEQKM